MDSYKSRISDGVLLKKRNRTSRCLKSHALMSQCFDTKRTHSRVPGVGGKAELTNNKKNDKSDFFRQVFLSVVFFTHV